ncbi:MAG: hypothetical protein JW854_07500 [Actinobacteria bacterium]|nr:hypothetical protein [Actinomycetota bacterium]
MRYPSKPSMAGLAAAPAVAVFLALLLAFTAGCSASTPQRAVGDFITARIAGDEERAAGLTVEEDLTGYIGGEPFLYATDVSYDVGQGEVENDRAVVTVTYFWGDQSVDIPYVTRRVGTKWKVALRESEELWFPEIEVVEESQTP